LTSNENGQRFADLLAVCPADGQFAIAQTMADQADLLENLAAVQATHPGVAQLYGLLTQIGLRGSQIEV